MLLLRLRSSTHMHHYIRYMQTGDRLKHSSIQFSSRNIVDYRDAVFFDATTCHIRPECIDLVIFCNIVSQTINEQIDPRMKDEVITEKSEVVEG